MTPIGRRRASLDRRRFEPEVISASRVVAVDHVFDDPRKNEDPALGAPGPAEN
jgi:hypothetical protein